MKIKEILDKLTIKEKIQLLSGIDGVYTKKMPQYGIDAKSLIDGPHGVRLNKESNCTMFPALSCLANSWDTELAEKMGSALGIDSIEHKTDMLLGPGLNIKRTPLCGRNFEYFSEDPVLAGEMAAGYIKGVQKQGVTACPKHYAANNQEKYRCVISADVDERTLREIYLKPFEIVVKKSKPEAIMSAYNKVNSVWCSENKYLLDEVLKKEWGFEGVVVSDYNAVHDPVKALSAGLDYQLPPKVGDEEKIKEALDNGEISIEQLDDAVKRILKFVLKPQLKNENYSRNNQHKIAREVAGESIVLLKNDNDILPLTTKKYKNIAIIGEYGKNALIRGQGSSEVYPADEFIDSPIEELKKLLPECNITYRQMYKRSELSETMIWPDVYMPEFEEFLDEADIVLVFGGVMTGEDTEMYDRRTLELNPNIERIAEAVVSQGKKMVFVLQSAGPVILNRLKDAADAIVQMGFGGEAAGGAVADVLCGVVNPSGKLSETYPTKLRTDIDYPGNGYYVTYNEKIDVGYRYYDKHPEQICYPFGYGLSYTEFSYSQINVKKTDKGFGVTFKMKNIGKYDGAEVVGLYISDVVSTVPKPIKELKRFKKVFLAAGEEKEIFFELLAEDFSYYNIMLHKWVAENGKYLIMIGSSSQDIRLEKAIDYNEKMPYSTKQLADAGVGDTSVCFG